jgi:hypothetical protein
VFDKCHLSLNLDFILGLTREIIDLSIIFKSFTRKWNLKFKVKDYIKKTIIENLHFDFKETQFLWYMSQSRFLVFRLSDFNTRCTQSPFKQDDKVSLCYFMRELSLYHVRTINEHVISGRFYCQPSEEKKVSGIFDIRDFEFKFLLNEKEMRMRYMARAWEFNLPDDIHFSGLIFEIVKQIMVSKKWFSQEYMKVKKKYNLSFMKPPPPSL